MPQFRFPQESKLFVRGFVAFLECDSLPSNFFLYTAALMEQVITILSTQKQREELLIQMAREEGFEAEKLRYLELVKELKEEEFEFKLSLDSLDLGLRDYDEYSHFRTGIQIQ